MTYRLEIRPDALADIEEAARWYDEQQSGLGSEFAREVIEAIDTALKNPLSYRLRHRRKNVRWKLLDRFPYRIVFLNYRRSHHGCSGDSQRSSRSGLETTFVMAAA